MMVRIFYLQTSFLLCLGEKCFVSIFFIILVDAEGLPEHEWGELDKDAERTEEVTSRLAVCNMDWDRIRAVDLMVLLNSFTPPGGIVRRVTVSIILSLRLQVVELLFIFTCM